MSTDEVTLENAYFEWLYSQIGPLKNRNPARNHWQLCRKLHSTEFYWFVPNDDNRVADGKELRDEFATVTRWAVDDEFIAWREMGCSVMEMMVALARLAAFESGRSAVEWFWRFLHNLELDAYSDDIYEIAIDEEVEEVLDRLIERKYGYDGKGGLFPLLHARRDQREIELWYQMSSYLLEGDYVNTRPRF
jgi:hypothetical protein